LAHAGRAKKNEFEQFKTRSTIAALLPNDDQNIAFRFDADVIFLRHSASTTNLKFSEAHLFRQLNSQQSRGQQRASYGAC